MCWTVYMEITLQLKNNASTDLKRRFLQHV